ncbi:FKBP-type peptidylprolyl isomerase [Larkinella terrae]|uniref:Peptidyl-prolyl cis-trans isomerase n=2 Tax=Larkinella terrae TaxID=2025311 RepID=A0A7K0EL97_9BACT|nr:FKBP-type peptidylprolyl isomerase [Larkinella terrae]
MIKYGFILLALVAVTIGCQPNVEQTPCDPTPVTLKAPQAEITALKQYIDSNKIAATADDRGFYYTIQAPGSGAKPTVCSTVTVNYAGKLTNGNTFDSANGITFGLNQLILGWQEGIPLISAGGSITLYLPPSLAYGSQAQSGIPANSILIFKIDLIRID